MSSTFGRLVRITTFGESHGPALGGIVDGFPAGMRIDMDMLARELCAILQHTVRMHILAGHIDRMLSSVLRMS